MRKLRIEKDDDGRPWIEQQNDDGGWTRIEHSSNQAPLRVGEVRGLRASSVDAIAGALDHPQQQFAKEVQAFAENLAAAAPTSVLDALKERFALPVPPESQAEVEKAKAGFKMPRPRSPLDAYPVPELPEQVPDPAYEVIAMLDKQNEILGEQRDVAVAEARSSANQAKRNLQLAWAAIGVTVAVGIAQIIVGIIQINLA